MTINIVEKCEKDAPATIAEMAVLNFAGEGDLRGISDKELAAISRRRADEIYNMSYLALAQMRMGKDELVAAIRRSGDPELWNTMLESLAGGQEDARCLLQFLSSAEARLMVALATIAQEEPDDDPDGGLDIPEEKSVAA